MKKQDREHEELQQLKLRPVPKRIEKLEREAQQRRRRVLLLIRGYIILAVFTALAIYGVAHLTSRLDDQAAKTCHVQARGLKANKHLRFVMLDIDTLIEPPDLKNPLARQLPKPPPTPAYYKPAIEGEHGLRNELPAYNQLQTEQPASRKC